ncbi:hypothetical protein TSOC_006219 [Tetrabaena socialis]|uniref:EGF-like domain-containing protein n=1 Tax=Tetrabaena socialis TaxID=47790 RepID=A0A2J8A484_9CHLO|nr:hypothetical protein TSOC_006219 [Tetrabaena socialis]|eukprot:PNH07315.1 hypothetical protein TSOC_006219 [Tetrabaena socialis]
MLAKHRRLLFVAAAVALVTLNALHVWRSATCGAPNTYRSSGRTLVTFAYEEANQIQLENFEFFLRAGVSRHARLDTVSLIYVIAPGPCSPCALWGGSEPVGQELLDAGIIQIGHAEHKATALYRSEGAAADLTAYNVSIEYVRRTSKLSSAYPLNRCHNSSTARAFATSTATSLPPDCSVSLYPLTLGQPLTAAPRAFTYDTLVLRDARQQLPSAATSRLTLTASFTTSDPADPPGLPAWVAARPVVLVAPSAEAAANASGGGGVLWPDGAAARMALTARGAQYTMDVGPWMIAADNALHVLFFNPLSAPRAVGYTLTLAVAGTCLADCSGHGACDAATGLCKCQAPFAGGDCSVDLSAFNGTACAAGSLRPVHLPDRRGTCWAGCKPDGSGFDDSGACAEFTCDGPGEGHGQLRRKGAEDECVEDACTCQWKSLRTAAQSAGSAGEAEAELRAEDWG